MKTHKIVLDDGEGLVHFVTEQECDPIIEHNKRLQNEPQRRAASFRHVAHIPDVWMLKWYDEMMWPGRREFVPWMGPEHMALVWRKLQDDDFKWLRTTDRQL